MKKFDDEDLEDLFDDSPEEPKKERKHSKHKKKKEVNFHVIILSVIGIVFVISVVRLLLWNAGFSFGKKPDIVNKSPGIQNDFDTEPLDSIVPVDSSSERDIPQKGDGELNILFVGNTPLTQNEGTDENFVTMVQNKTGANVYNAGITDSFLSSKNPTYDGKYPQDAFSFYYLSTLIALKNQKTIDWAKRDMGGELPQDISKAIEVLETVDYEKLDALCIFYDASDCLDSRLSYIDNESSNIQTTAGALEAGVQLIKEAYPNLRIIVMSPTFSYFPDKKGNKISGFETPKGTEHSLFIHVIHMQDTSYLNGVSFVDNFYGTIYEEIADKYLEDNYRVNQEGRKLLVDRFIYALNYFNDYKLPEVGQG